jgi:hypothetical protein
MKSTASVFIIIVLSLVFASCAATQPIVYAPSNLITGTGTVSVTRFSYTAARKGQIAPNQPERILMA